MVGGVNGSLVMTTVRRLAPLTSTPSQKLLAPRSTVLPPSWQRFEKTGAAAVLAVGEDAVIGEALILLEGLLHFVEHGVGGEEHEHVAVDGGNKLFEIVHDGARVLEVAGLGIVLVVVWNGDQGLMRVIKRRGVDGREIFFRREEKFIGGVFEIAIHGEGCRGEHDGFLSGEELFVDSGMMSM